MSDTVPVPEKKKFNAVKAAMIFFIVFDSLVFYGSYLNHRNVYLPVSLTAPAPDFMWKSFDGSTHQLKELSGHVVVLHFWASWCPPCREEFPKMLKAATDNPDMRFIAISSDADAQKAQNFITMSPATSGITPPSNVLYAWDPTKAITYDLFLTNSYPESIVIDATQRMRRKYPAPVDWDSKEVRDYLAAVKAGKFDDAGTKP